MQDPRADEFRAIWRRKPVLRAIYGDYYRRMLSHCRSGRTLEIGGGSGNFKNYAPDVVSSDIQCTPWLDVVADAQALPFSTGSFANIVMLDVLHHIEYPKLFFQEAERVLSPGGRLVLIEPGITPISWLFYKLLHHEPVDLSADPLSGDLPCSERDPYAANQAIPSIVFGRGLAKFSATFPRLQLVHKCFLSLFAYPLSGGFKPWSLIPAGIVDLLLRLESHLAIVLAPLMGFRLLVVLERAP